MYLCVCVCVLAFIYEKDKKGKEEYLGRYCEKLKTRSIKEALKRHSNFLESFLENLTKNTIIKSKEGKTLLENKEKADRWQQYVGELYNDSD